MQYGEGTASDSLHQITARGDIDKITKQKINQNKTIKIEVSGGKENLPFIPPVRQTSKVVSKSPDPNKHTITSI